MKTQRSHGSLVLRLEAELYPEPVLFKCFYWYGDEFVTDITKDDGDYVVTLKKRDGVMLPGELELLEDRVKRDLVDFKTRDIVAKETRAIRELIAAKAFSSVDDYDQEPPGDPPDAVGYDQRHK